MCFLISKFLNFKCNLLISGVSEREIVNFAQKWTGKNKVYGKFHPGKYTGKKMDL